MRAILIDPVTQTVTVVDYSGDYREIYALLSDKDHGLDVTAFDCVRLNATDAIYIDDNGLLNDPKYFFMWKGYAQPLAGRGLILATDVEGETIGTNLNLKWVARQVSFGKFKVQGFEHGAYDREDGMHVIWNRPVFGPAEGE